MLANLPKALRDDDTAPFWEGCDAGEFWIQKCTDCDAFRWPPGPVCSSCGSLHSEWISATGDGALYSWVVVHVPLADELADQVPYAVGLVELDEGIRVVSTISECQHSDLRAGLRLRVDFGQPAQTIFSFVPA